MGSARLSPDEAHFPGFHFAAGAELASERRRKKAKMIIRSIFTPAVVDKLVAPIDRSKIIEWSSSLRFGR